jgi:hypothetical protein
MFETTTYFLQNTTGRNTHWGEEFRVSPAARQLYRSVRQQARVGQFVADFTGRQTRQRLIDLNGFTSGRTSGARRSAGIQTVRLNEIRGSVGRCDDFDAAFHPLKANTEQRWLRVATARQDGLGLPPVQLIRVGDNYFLLDGHHRVSVARSRGELEIEAEVTVWELV